MAPAARARLVRRQQPPALIRQRHPNRRLFEDQAELLLALSQGALGIGAGGHVPQQDLRGVLTLVDDGDGSDLNFDHAPVEPHETLLKRRAIVFLLVGVEAFQDPRAVVRVNEVQHTGILGMALGFGLWWVYFDFVARRQFRPGIWWSLTWGYLHLPLVMSIAATGAGVTNVIASEEAFLPDAVRLLISGAVSAALLIIGLIELTLRQTTHEPTDYRVSVSLKIGAGLIALSLGVWGSGLGYLGLLFFLFLCILAQMIYGAYVWFRQPLSEPA